MPSPEYYHRQADLCLRMALLTSEYEERLRLLAIANGYRDDAVRVEALRSSTEVTASRRSISASPGVDGASVYRVLNLSV